jgi:type I restriction enzyme M protein
VLPPPAQKSLTAPALQRPKRFALKFARITAACEAGMGLLKFLGSDDFAHSLKTLSATELKSLEAVFIEKGEKAYFRCPVRKKDIAAKPEEAIRQLWIIRLTKHYAYPLSRLAVEYPITFGRDTSKRADIVVFDADRPTVPYIIIEVKQAKLKDGKEQLKSYTHATGAPLALWSNGAQSIAWHRKNPNYFVEIPDVPALGQTIDDVAGQPWTIDTLIEKEKEREREGTRARSLRDLIVDLEDEVLANAGVDVFEEVFKLVFTKLYDEMACYRGTYKHLRFRNSNTAAQVKSSIQSLFDDAKKKWPGVFLDDDRLRLSADHLQVCVGSLEEWKLFNSNLDVIDDAFEYLVSKSAKGEKGQYFTPRWVIDMCVKMLNPQDHETVIDPACGSAGFTVHAMFQVWRQILIEEGLPVSHLFTMVKKPQRCVDYVQEKVFALDFDEKSVRVARCLNLIAGDGETNVLHLNSLDWMKWDETVKQDEWQDPYGGGWRKFRKFASGQKQKDYRRFGFDVLMANPPFAGDIKQTDMLTPYELAHKANGKFESAVGRDILFIERNLDFLRPGGRMAIVLPQGRFNNSSDQRIREFIMERCRVLAVVGLHPNTFKPHTGTKTSVLFVQKWNDDPDAGPLCPKIDDYNIFFATQQVESVNNRGEKVYVKDGSGNILRDTHGHFIVAHDLYNHDDLTKDGVAEAFAEFAKQEGLSFFR